MDNYVNDFNDATNEESADENTSKDNNEPEMEHKERKRRKSKVSKNDEEYQKLFNEYRNIFDLSCDCCTKVFESLNEAQKHYASAHNKFQGYIKSTNGKKLFRPGHVVQYVDRHLNKFKYVCNYFP